MSSPRLSRLLNDGAALRRNGLPFIPLSQRARLSAAEVIRPSLREIAAARYPRGSASSDRSTSTVTTPVPRSPATSVGSSTVIHHAPRSAPRSASRSSESVAAADSRAPCTSTRSRPSESAGYDRALADAATARLNAKFPGCFRLTSGSRPSAPALKSAMKQPGSRKVEKRVQFIGEHVKIVDRWIVPGVHIWSDPYSGPKVTPLATPDMDGEVEDWRARLTQVRARFDARRAQFHERRDRLRSESAERSARYI
ncbi:hypothetical protein PRK78_005535 [Emydomyces testavorans]|uniref:Uncharacterized protein n=1 Tax=Emydomyces testavorans TaxID=2070801 RepID=A0AAF0DMB3_9EURO|nr:hypothetical protein PRK78_005535 [Emydomyces testavorans]